MAVIVQTPLAQTDTKIILRKLAKHSRSAAEQFAENLTTRIRFLATSPGFGRPRPSMGSGIRSTVVGDYIVLYHASIATVTVIRVLHGARNLQAIWDKTKWNAPESNGLENDS